MLETQDCKIICVLGGCGSTYLSKILGREGICVLRKPDTVYSRHNLILGEYYRDDEKQDYFLRRAPLLFGTRASNPDELFDLIQELMDRDDVIFLSSSFYEMKMFSRNQIPNVCFLVRNARDGYLSYCKEQRHGKVSEALGGVASRRSMEFYASRWNSLVDEYRRLVEANLSPKLITYEKFPGDIGRIFPHLSTADFEYGRRNDWEKRGEHSVYFDKLVSKNQKYIYKRQ